MDQKNCQKLDDRTVRLFNGRKTEGNAFTLLTNYNQRRRSWHEPMILTLSLLSLLSKNILMQGVHTISLDMLWTFHNIKMSDTLRTLLKEAGLYRLKVYTASVSWTLRLSNQRQLLSPTSSDLFCQRVMSLCFCFVLVFSYLLLCFELCCCALHFRASETFG